MPDTSESSTTPVPSTGSTQPPEPNYEMASNRSVLIVWLIGLGVFIGVTALLFVTNVYPNDGTPVRSSFDEYVLDRVGPGTSTSPSVFSEPSELFSSYLKGFYSVESDSTCGVFLPGIIESGRGVVYYAESNNCQVVVKTVGDQVTLEVPARATKYTSGPAVYHLERVGDGYVEKTKPE